MLPLLLLLAACGPSFEARALVDGPFVRVSSYDFEAGDVVSVGDVSREVGDDPFDFHLDVPVESLGVGAHALEVTVDRGGSVSTKTVEVTLTEKHLETYLQLGPCDSMVTGDDLVLVKTTSPVWKLPFGWEEDTCRVLDGQLSIPVLANADATVTIGGEPVALEGGRATWTGFNLGLLTGQVPLTQLGSTLEGNVDITATVPVVVRRPGQEDVTQTVTMTVPVRALRSHAQDQLQALTPGEAPRWPRSAHDGAPRGLVMAAKESSVTLDGEARSAVPGGYWPVRTLGPEGATADQVDLFAVATPVDITPNGSCRFNVVMSGHGGLSNKLFDQGYEVVVYDPAGKEVARRTFPKPSKPSCPSSISGTGEKTIVLWNPPPSADVLRWLETVRSGDAG